MSIAGLTSGKANFVDRPTLPISLSHSLLLFFYAIGRSYKIRYRHSPDGVEAHRSLIKREPLSAAAAAAAALASMRFSC